MIRIEVPANRLLQRHLTRWRPRPLRELTPRLGDSQAVRILVQDDQWSVARGPWSVVRCRGWQGLAGVGHGTRRKRPGGFRCPSPLAPGETSVARPHTVGTDGTDS